ncbi:MAG: hypothetical protein PHF87_00780 [Desulfotomaculaceae bacterium]|nr:hypothetical protein [Desulfotomaculaceae bacterium]
MGVNTKSKRFIAIAILNVALLALPTLVKVHYAALYYAVIILLIPITIYRIVFEEKFEKRFYQRWHKAREQGFWINVVREGLRTLVFMVVVVSISQFFGNGLTPIEIMSKLPGNALAWILLLLLAFSLIAGIIALYENNNRYIRIYYAKKNN